MAPVQLAIRLLIPQGSRLLELDDTRQFISEFDAKNLCYPWQHPDPKVDELQGRIEAIVENACKGDVSRIQTFERIWNETTRAIGAPPTEVIDFSSLSLRQLPYLSEDWYCCAEPTKQQMEILL